MAFVRVLVAVLVVYTSAADIPTVLLKNAAVPGTRYPMIGLGLRGPGYKLGQTQECWRYPTCCTKDYCPSVNATRDWLKLGGWRLDTGYPFGDSGGHALNGTTCGSKPPHSTSDMVNLPTLGAHFCDPHGTRIGIAESGLKREDIFITIKYGFAGPMQEPDKGDHQGDNMIYWLGTNYTDLALMHEGDLGGTGHNPSPFCAYPTTPACRIRVFKGCIEWMGKGKTRACGVANWEVEWLQQLKDANVTLPSVVQMKFHPHQSFVSKRIRDVKEFCDANDIVFNGYSPLGRADWTTFEPPMKPTLFEEPLVQEIARKVRRSPAQVLIRWAIQQGIPTNARSMNPDHMKENMDVFDWELSEGDMHALSNMPQCDTVRGDPFMPGDPEYPTHDNMIGPTPHC